MCSVGRWTLHSVYDYMVSVGSFSLYTHVHMVQESPHVSQKKKKKNFISPWHPSKETIHTSQSVNQSLKASRAFLGRTKQFKLTRLSLRLRRVSELECERCECGPQLMKKKKKDRHWGRSEVRLADVSLVVHAVHGRWLVAVSSAVKVWQTTKWWV